MTDYELMTILHSRLTADEAAAAVELVGSQIAAHGGEVLSTDVWGRRRLAYPIAGAMEGTYVLHTLNLPPEGTAPLEAWLGVSEQVIRHLLIRGIIPYTGRAQDDRDRDRDRDRDDRDDRDRDDDRDGDDRDDRGRDRDDMDRPAMDAPAVASEMVGAMASDDADAADDE